MYTGCIQDTLSSRAALGLQAAAFRPSASREQRYLAYKYTRCPIVAFTQGVWIQVFGQTLPFVVICNQSWSNVVKRRQKQLNWWRRRYRPMKLLRYTIQAPRINVTSQFVLLQTLLSHSFVFALDNTLAPYFITALLKLDCGNWLAFKLKFLSSICFGGRVRARAKVSCIQVFFGAPI